MRIAVSQDVSGNVSFSMTPSAALESTIRHITGLSGDSALFDSAKIRGSFAGSGFSVQSVSFPSPSGINLTVKTDDLETALAPENKWLTVSAYEGGHSMDIVLSPETAAALLALMPSETADYAELLMAPLFTGERMTEDEYVDLIAVTYGNTLAGELREAVVSVTVDVPGTVTGASAEQPVRVGRENTRAVFTVPLAKILSLSGPLYFNIQWK